MEEFSSKRIFLKPFSKNLFYKREKCVILNTVNQRDAQHETERIVKQNVALFIVAADTSYDDWMRIALEKKTTEIPKTSGYCFWRNFLY